MASSPGSLAHKAKAQHNFDFVQSLSPTTPRYPDWVVIGSFYTALHCVCACASKIGWKWKKYPSGSTKKISMHTQELRFVQKNFPHLFTYYERLFQECWNARYDPLYLNRISTSMPNDMFRIASMFMTIV